MERPINYTRCFIEWDGRHYFAMYEQGIDCFRLPDKNTIKFNQVTFWLKDEDFSELINMVKGVRLFFD